MGERASGRVGVVGMQGMVVAVWVGVDRAVAAVGRAFLIDGKYARIPRELQSLPATLPPTGRCQHQNVLEQMYA